MKFIIYTQPLSHLLCVGELILPGIRLHAEVELVPGEHLGARVAGELARLVLRLGPRGHLLLRFVHCRQGIGVVRVLVQLSHGREALRDDGADVPHRILHRMLERL